MNLNQAFDLANKSTTLGYDNIRKLTEINMSTWEKMVEAQMSIMNTCFETTGKQIELLETVKRPDELFGKQAELAQELGEKLVEKNKEVFEVLSQTRDEYQELAEAGVQQAKSQMEEVAAVAKNAQAA
jgi:phasin family protein